MNYYREIEYTNSLSKTSLENILPQLFISSYIYSIIHFIGLKLPTSAAAFLMMNIKQC